MSHPNTAPINLQFHSARHISILGPLSRAHITQLPNPISHQGDLGSISGPAMTDTCLTTQYLVGFISEYFGFHPLIKLHRCTILMFTHLPSTIRSLCYFTASLKKTITWSTVDFIVIKTELTQVVANHKQAAYIRLRSDIYRGRIYNSFFAQVQNMNAQ